MSKELTAGTFESAVVSSELPVLVDFCAEWCGPCRALGPVVEEVARDLDGRLEVYKCNVDEQGELAQRFSIMSIPTLILFKNGIVTHTMVGSMPKAKLMAELSAHL
jgi:thioredoxin 1